MNKLKVSKYFVYTGNAYPHKNLPRLIEAIKILNEELKSKVKLKMVVGRSEFVSRLVSNIRKLKAEKYIEVLDYQTDRELNTLYKNSIAFVFPTLSEGFGLPPMEAVNAGTIAAVSDIEVMHEVYEDNVIYFDATNPKSIATTLKEVLKMNKSEKNKRISNAQNFLKKYSWQKMAQETLKVYNSVYGI